MAPDTPIRILIYLLHCDLRLSDNPIFHEIQQSFESGSAKFTHLLPLYILRPHQIETSGFIPVEEDAKSTPQSPYPEARSKVAGFWRCGPHKAKFIAESVWDLKNTLEQKESSLIIRVGKVRDILRGIFHHVEKTGDSSVSSSLQQQVVGVWMTKGDGCEERQEEAGVKELVEELGREYREFQDEKYYVHEYGFHVFATEVCMA